MIWAFSSCTLPELRSVHADLRERLSFHIASALRQSSPFLSVHTHTSTRAQEAYIMEEAWCRLLVGA